MFRRRNASSINIRLVHQHLNLVCFKLQLNSSLNTRLLSLVCFLPVMVICSTRLWLVKRPHEALWLADAHWPHVLLITGLMSALSAPEDVKLVYSREQQNSSPIPHTFRPVWADRSWFPMAMLSYHWLDFFENHLVTVFWNRGLQNISKIVYESGRWYFLITVVAPARIRSIDMSAVTKTGQGPFSGRWSTRSCAGNMSDMNMMTRAGVQCTKGNKADTTCMFFRGLF